MAMYCDNVTYCAIVICQIHFKATSNPSSGVGGGMVAIGTEAGQVQLKLLCGCSVAIVSASEFTPMRARWRITVSCSQSKTALKLQGLDKEKRA